MLKKKKKKPIPLLELSFLLPVVAFRLLVSHTTTITDLPSCRDASQPPPQRHHSENSNHNTSNNNSNNNQCFGFLGAF